MTAIDFLIEYCDRENWSIPNNILEQAKEMEKQNLNTAHKHGMELREYEIFEWLKCQDYDFLVEEIIKSE